MHQLLGVGSPTSPGDALNATITTNSHDSSIVGAQSMVSRHDLTVGQAGMQVPVPVVTSVPAPVVTSMQRGTCAGSVYTPRGGHSYPPPGTAPATVMTATLEPPPPSAAVNNGWGDSPAHPDVSWAAGPKHNFTSNWGNLSQVNVNQTPPQYNPAYANIVPNHGTPPPLNWKTSLAAPPSYAVPHTAPPSHAAPHLAAPPSHAAPHQTFGTLYELCRIQRKLFSLHHKASLLTGQ
jgi:hypothetical protein